MALDWQALGAKKTENLPNACRRSPAGGPNSKGETFEKGKTLELITACIKRVMGLTAKVSGPQNAGPLDRRVRPEGQKEAPGLGQGRSPRKSAGPRKRRTAARMIAAGACCASAGGKKGLKTPWTTQSAGIGDCAHEAGDGTNGQGKPPAVGGSA